MMLPLLPRGSVCARDPRSKSGSITTTIRRGRNPRVNVRLAERRLRAVLRAGADGRCGCCSRDPSDDNFVRGHETSKYGAGPIANVLVDDREARAWCSSPGPRRPSSSDEFVRGDPLGHRCSTRARRRRQGSGAARHGAAHDRRGRFDYDPVTYVVASARATTIVFPHYTM